ncbi:hypothetical protein SLEP1_g54623 [Rubroshorea leprosula]|uniref:Uncharacterized protein n=1 Tax=Rubroshorea leprosula TaxID=152421 RepID=A0AAV5MG52_9ROSI|nr:hypothetical protein SLEP1_g54623 [Rubroshorea leprosula]
MAIHTFTVVPIIADLSIGVSTSRIHLGALQVNPECRYGLKKEFWFGAVTRRKCGNTSDAARCADGYRNGDIREVNWMYYDRDVCRLYLSGLCPHEFFQLTASLPQPLPNPLSLAPLPVLAPDPWTQETINEKLKKAEDLDKTQSRLLSYCCLGEEGMVDKAQKALEEAETLKKHFARQEPVLNSSKYTAADVRIMN